MFSKLGQTQSLQKFSATVGRFWGQVFSLTDVGRIILQHRISISALVGRGLVKTAKETN